ncbi:MAG: hypothetical protein HY912_23260 [Desulfomonile tiedjei]|uniref:Uncharacterized protein n=1 Tax=Desulfomonile tiedjei TaxID=2358 RepID=A0A9D6V6H1_9BACT|nr:hypothetical protein [Desulfomonile tiedjei]
MWLPKNQCSSTYNVATLSSRNPLASSLGKTPFLIVHSTPARLSKGIFLSIPPPPSSDDNDFNLIQHALSWYKRGMHPLGADTSSGLGGTQGAFG